MEAGQKMHSLALCGLVLNFMLRFPQTLVKTAIVLNVVLQFSL